MHMMRDDLSSPIYISSWVVVPSVTSIGNLGFRPNINRYGVCPVDIMVYLRRFTPTKAPTLKAKWLENSVNLPVWRNQEPPVIILWGMACAKGSTGSVMTKICWYPPLDFSNVRKSMQTNSNGEEVTMGMCERFNRTLLNMLWSLESHQKQNGKAYLGPMIHSYNCTRHASTGQTPYLLMFGRNPRLPIDVKLGLHVEWILLGIP
jgi:hypothetical protein